MTLLNNGIYISFVLNFTDWATVVGYLLISRPFIGSSKDNLSHSERLEVLITFFLLYSLLLLLLFKSLLSFIVFKQMHQSYFKKCKC